MRHQTVTTRRTEEPEDVLHCFQDECAKCCGLSESYARPGRCVNEACDGRMIAVKYVRAEEVQTLRDQLERAVAAGDALADAVRALDSYAALGGAPMERTARADAALRAWAARGQ